MAESARHCRKANSPSTYLPINSKRALGKLLDQLLARFADGVDATEGAMFTKQNTVRRIITLQVFFQFAAGAAVKMICKYFSGGSRVGQE